MSKFQMILAGGSEGKTTLTGLLALHPSPIDMLRLRASIEPSIITPEERKVLDDYEEAERQMHLRSAYHMLRRVSRSR